MTTETRNLFDQEELAGKLANFGLTVNQAKVYLSVVQFGITSVSRIAQNTQLHRQDIYKMMPKLQKKGLVTKIMGKPLKFEVTPIEIAVDILVLEEKRRAKERISRLLDDLESLKKEVKCCQNQKSLLGKDPKFVLLTTDAEIRNKLEVSFESADKEFCIVTTPKLAPRITNIISGRINTLGKKGVKTRIIIESHTDEATKNLIEKLDRTHSYLTAKQVPKESLVPYRLLDNKEVWIALTKETESGRPCFLWTDAANIVNFYQKNFEKTWKDPNAKRIINQT